MANMESVRSKSPFSIWEQIWANRETFLDHYPEVARELEALAEKARQDLGDGEREREQTVVQ